MDANRSVGKSRPVQAPVDAERTTHPAGPGREQMVLERLWSATTHLPDSPHRLERAKQDGACLSFPSRDDVHAVMHSVREVDVQDTRGTEHDPRTAVRRAMRVGAGISRATVGFRLDDSAADEVAPSVTDEEAADQVPSDDQYVALVEDCRQRRGRGFVAESFHGGS